MSSETNHVNYNMNAKQVTLDTVQTLILTIGVVLFWRGGWLLLDWMFANHSTTEQALISLSVGIGLLIVIMILWFFGCLSDNRQSVLNPTSTKTKVAKHYYISLLLKYFIFVSHGISCVAIWRGIWYLMDVWFVINISGLSDRENEFIPLFLSMVVGIILLLPTQQVSAIFAVPLVPGITDTNQQLNKKFLFSTIVKATLIARNYIFNKIKDCYNSNSNSSENMTQTNSSINNNNKQTTEKQKNHDITNVNV